MDNDSVNESVLSRPVNMSGIKDEGAHTMERGIPDQAEARKLFCNFMLMAVCFSINHATVRSHPALATFDALSR